MLAIRLPAEVESRLRDLLRTVFCAEPPCAPSIPALDLLGFLRARPGALA